MRRTELANVNHHNYMYGTYTTQRFPNLHELIRGGTAAHVKLKLDSDELVYIGSVFIYYASSLCYSHSRAGQRDYKKSVQKRGSHPQKKFGNRCW